MSDKEVTRHKGRPDPAPIASMGNGKDSPSDRALARDLARRKTLRNQGNAASARVIQRRAAGDGAINSPFAVATNSEVIKFNDSKPPITLPDARLGTPAFLLSA